MTIQIKCTKCNGKGCKKCNNTGWVKVINRVQVGGKKVKNHHKRLSGYKFQITEYADYFSLAEVVQMLQKLKVNQKIEVIKLK